MNGPACKEGGGLALPASEGMSQIGEEKKGEEGEEGRGRGSGTKLRDVSDVALTGRGASPEFARSCGRSNRARESKATP